MFISIATLDLVEGLVTLNLLYLVVVRLVLNWCLIRVVTVSILNAIVHCIVLSLHLVEESWFLLFSFRSGLVKRLSLMSWQVYLRIMRSSNSLFFRFNLIVRRLLCCFEEQILRSLLPWRLSNHHFTFTVITYAYILNSRHFMISLN